MYIPSPQHYLLEEKEWIDKRRYFMGLKDNRPISSEEATDDFLKKETDDNGLTLEEKFELYYVGTFIIPTCFNGGIDDSHNLWVKSRLDEFDKILEKHFSNKRLENRAVAA